MTALITGASSGIGKDIAYILANLKYDLVLVARSGNKLNKIKHELEEKYQIKVINIIIDLSLSESPEIILKVIKDYNITIDILINNAGYGINNYFKDIPFEKENAMLQLLINNQIHLTKLFLPGMIEKKSGYILNVSSTAAFQPTPTYSSYAASKAFTLSFSGALGYELKKHNIHVCVLCPGFTKTGFQEASDHKKLSSISKATMMSSQKVAQIAINKMFKKKKVIIPGLFNKFGALMTRFLPIPLLAKLAFGVVGFGKK